MPIDLSTYPPNWQEIRERIQKRAGNKCEFCEVPNGMEVIRDLPSGKWYSVPEVYGLRVELPMNDWLDLFGAEPSKVRIVLTTAHLDHDIQNNEDSNLRFLCQQCHNRHDAVHRAKSRARKRLEAKGQLTMFGDVTE
jgi:hypothetical protein